MMDVEKYTQMTYNDWLIDSSFAVGRGVAGLTTMFMMWAYEPEGEVRERLRDALAEEMYRDLAICRDIPDDDPKRVKDREAVEELRDAMKRIDGEKGSPRSRIWSDAWVRLESLVGYFTYLNVEAMRNPWDYISEKDREMLKRMAEEREKNGASGGSDGC